MATTKVDYAQTGLAVLDAVGGEENVSSLAHCATRLRFTLEDNSVPNKAEVMAIPGVITVMEAGGLYQVVIGNDVVKSYDSIMAHTSLASDVREGGAGEKSKNPFSRFISMISALFSPIIWTLAATGLIKAFLALFTAGIPLLNTESQSYAILNSLGDAFIYFMPLALAVSGAKYFKVNVGTSIAIAAFLVYPTIYGMFEAGNPVSFFGIPVVMAPYVYSVFPIVVAVWVQSIIEPRLMKSLPSWMRNFTVPFIVLTVVGLLTLIIVGPIITAATNLVAAGLTWIWGPMPWLGGFMMGMFWQVFVMFGLHWGLTPIMMNEIAVDGYSLLFGALPSAVVAQCAAALAVSLRTKDQKLRQMGLPTSIAGFFSGVTEPIVYGVNLPLKKPFLIGITAGGIGGALAATGGSGSTANVFASVLTLPAFLGVGNFTLQLIGVATAGILGFVVTFMFGIPKEQAEVAVASTGGAPDLSPEASQLSAPLPADSKIVPADAVVVPANAVVTLPADSTNTTDLVAPATGQAIPLSAIDDPVFSSGAMGQGLGVIPTDGRVYAPIAGKVVTAMATGHAFGIRSETGVEVLIHVGVDTVQMNGDGFTPHVAKGDTVTAGQPLLTFDRSKVAAAGYSDTVITIITNSGSFTTIEPRVGGSLVAGEIAVIVER